MLRTTLGRLLVEESLPEEMRNYSGQRRLDAKGIRALFQELAEKYPGDYRAIAKRLTDIGRDVSQSTGGFSFGLKHLRQSKTYSETRQRLEGQIEKILDDDKLDEKIKQQRIIELVGKEQKPLEEAIYQEAQKADNPLALQVLSGTRGKPMNLKSLLGADLLYQDQRDRIIPVPVLKSYSAGLSPAEYFAGAFGARKGVWDVKKATAEAGFFNKQLIQAVHRLLVTKQDADKDPEHILRGLPVDTDDFDSEGSLLSYAAGGYPRNTVITPKILKDLQAKGVKRIVVRSPIVGGPPEGGLYGRDVGVREKGIIAPNGDWVGIAGAQAIGEPVAQGGLCLAKGTLIRMADGTTKEIEVVAPGEKVLCAWQHSPWENGYRTLEVGPAEVLRVFKQGVKKCYLATFGKLDVHYRPMAPEENIHLLATLDHNILSKILKNNEDTAPRRQYTAKPLGLGLLSVGEDAKEWYLARCWEQGCSIIRALLDLDPDDEVETFDLEIDHPQHLFVLANGLVVSNSSKHSGGVVGSAKSVSGFKMLDQLIQIPKTFRGGAAHAEIDGRVAQIADAPAGGKYVFVEDVKHYVSPGVDLKVKVGDRVEAGDILSAGIPNPAKIVQYKGIGDGRRYFLNIYRQALKDAGTPAHRRNLELLARGFINHVRLTDEMGPYAPGDVIGYDQLEHDWEPREGARKLAVKAAVGKYLEKPVLHYTVGTKIRPSMLPEFDQFGVKELEAHDDPPPFEPEMIRGMEALQYDPDWLSRMLGSYLEKGFLRGVARGDVSDSLGTSYVPALANPTNFGRRGLTRGFESLPAPAPKMKPTSVLEGF